MDTAQLLVELDLVVATILAAEAHPGARGPSALLRLDLGPRGERQATVPLALDEARALVGREVVCTAGEDVASVLLARGHERSVVVGPSDPAGEGTPVA
jgi:tRNA-binding EMAP/Myf-like protein